MTFELVMAILALAMTTVLMAGKVVDYAKQQKKNGNGNGGSKPAGALTPSEMRALHDWTRDLHHWHAKEDEDGRKVWYNDRQLADAMKKIGDAMTIQTEILRRMDDRLCSAIDHQPHE